MPTSANPKSAQNPLQAVLAARVAQQQRQQQAAATTVMPTAARATAILQPARSPQIMSPGQPSAQECYQHLQRSTSSCRNAMMEIAYYGYRLRQADSWAELGFESEENCYEELGIPQATWNRYLLLGERLAQLTLEQLRSLSLTSAQWLARVNSRIWNEYAWVEEARLLTAHDFAALVEQRNADCKLLAAKSAVTEGTVEFKVRVAPSRMRSFKQRLEKLRQVYDVRSVADALERALAAAEKELASNAEDSPKISVDPARADDAAL